VAKEFLGKGWKFPVSIDGKGTIRMSEFEDDIKEAIWIILSTAEGERVMRPDFGCGIHDLIFSPINTNTINMVESSIREALIKWEPRIEILNIEISREKADVGQLLVSIDYRVRTTNSEFNMVYPFYLGEK